MSTSEATPKLSENTVSGPVTLKKESPKLIIFRSALHMITALSANDGKNQSEKLEAINMLAETALKSAKCVK